MTDLILPDHLKNPVLNNNLKLFFKRYPYERGRLEDLLKKPNPVFQRKSVDLPEVPSKPPIRIVVLTGLADPAFLEKYINDKTVKAENYLTIAIENNVDTLAWFFQTVDLSPILLNDKWEFLFCVNESQVKARLFNVLKREHIGAMMDNAHMFNTNSEPNQEIQSFYNKVGDNNGGIYNEVVGHVMHNYGCFEDSMIGVRATMKNKNAILNYPGIAPIKNLHKGKPALVISAGPSLDGQLELIKANQDKFVIIATDATVKPLQKAGIRFDYVTSIERLNNYQKPFFEGMEETNAVLVCFPVVLPDLLDLYRGPVRIVYRNYSYFAYFEKAWPKGMLRCGGSTGHLAVRMAQWLGCSKAYLIGIDSSYEEKDGLYRSHCSDTGYPEWGEFIPLEDFTKKRNHLPIFEAVNNEGKVVKTNTTYFQWIKEFSEELTIMSTSMPVVNCSSLGIKIEGIPYKPLSEIVELYDAIPLTPDPKDSPVINRKWDHKVLLQNIRAWLKLTDLSLEVLEDLLKTPDAERDLKHLDILYQVLNFRFMADNMFVAFAIQQCASEYFWIENKWWGLDINRREVEVTEKIQVTKEKFQLFKQVLEVLLETFDEKGKIDNVTTIEVHQQRNAGISESSDSGNESAEGGANSSNSETAARESTGNS